MVTVWWLEIENGGGRLGGAVANVPWAGVQGDGVVFPWAGVQGDGVVFND